ncbi:glycosyltransferase family 2 protein [Luteolibacter algae]|uniref:Glycosyltransferase family 2 protein n=1 Tax=Luteolibacter algae TaxID=454151 RepID=A0ABW5D4U8_9BACT
MKTISPYSSIIRPTVSFIIPAKDEEATLATLCTEIQKQMENLRYKWEIVLIDDGSTDGTWSEMLRLASELPKNIVSLRFRQNMGKADALSLGYAESNGDVIFTMDADLQDDPNEIPRFLEKIEEGYDIVTGWKQKRHDPWHKVLPSRVFNAMLSHIVGVKLHDHNCGFKAYRREVAKQLPMYGEMHRMVPSLASFEGFKTAELVVLHHPRKFGKSKYGVKRILCGIFDMTTVGFLKTYRNRPMHFFGRIAIVLSILALAIWTGAVATLVMGGSGAASLLLAGTVLIAAAVSAVGQGLSLEHRVHANMEPGRSLPVAERSASQIPQLRVVPELDRFSADLGNEEVPPTAMGL